MFRIEEKGEELIIKEFPVWNWFGYFIFLSFLIYIFYSDLLETIGVSIPSIAKFFLIASLGGILAYIFSPVIKIHINKRKQTLTISKENLLKNEINIYSLKEIEDAIFVEEKKMRFKKELQLVLPLKNGEKLKLSSLNGSQDNDYFETAEVLNKFIFNQPKQIP